MSLSLHVPVNLTGRLSLAGSLGSGPSLSRSLEEAETGCHSLNIGHRAQPSGEKPEAQAVALLR